MKQKMEAKGIKIRMYSYNSRMRHDDTSGCWKMGIMENAVVG
jgi:hypothetical protein